MITVVDQVRPWLTPSRTFAATIQPQRRRPDQQQRDRDRHQPAGDQHRLAAEPVRPGAGEVVGRRLGHPEREDVGQRGGVRRRARTRAWPAAAARCAPGPSIPPTRALTATSRVNWASVRAQPQRDRARSAGRPAPRAELIAHLQRRAGRLGPVVGAADQHGDVGATGAGQQARGAHRALSVPAHHDGGAAGSGVGVGRQVAQLDVRRAGHVPGGELAVLPDVQHRGAGRRVAHRAGLDEGDGRDSLPGGGPCAHAAGELTGEVVVADLQGLPGDLAGVLVDAPDDDQGTVGGDDPAQPGGERRTQRDRDRAGDVPGGELGDRTDVDDLRARRPQPRHVRGAESAAGSPSPRPGPVPGGSARGRRPKYGG